MKKSEKDRLSRLLKKCVLECIEISKKMKVVFLYDSKMGIPVENITPGIGTVYTSPDFKDVFGNLQNTKAFENLSQEITPYLPSLFKSRVDDIIYITLHRAIFPIIIPGTRNLGHHRPYLWNNDNFQRALRELIYQFQQPENGSRFIAPIFNFNVRESTQIDSRISIRKATPYDRRQISESEYSSAYISDDYDCVLEIKSDIDLKPSFDTKPMYEKFIEFSGLSMTFVSCLRLFSGNLSHLRFGAFIVQDGGFTGKFPGLIESPELALRSTPDPYILHDRDTQELSQFWGNYKKGLNHPHFRRADYRYFTAIMNREETGKFVDLVLSLESLFKGSMIDIQYRAASLVSYNSKIRFLVYDFLDIVRSQRNKIMHGSTGFGKEYRRRSMKFYGEKKDSKWFNSDLTALVRQCLRMSVITNKLDNKEWSSSLKESLFQKSTNRNLVGKTKRWARKGLPSFF